MLNFQNATGMILVHIRGSSKISSGRQHFAGGRGRDSSMKIRVNEERDRVRCISLGKFTADRHEVSSSALFTSMLYTLFISEPRQDQIVRLHSLGWIFSASSLAFSGTFFHASAAWSSRACDSRWSQLLMYSYTSCSSMYRILIVVERSKAGFFFERIRDGGYFWTSTHLDWGVRNGQHGHGCSTF
jgi:hypothetical protein